MVCYQRDRSLTFGPMRNKRSFELCNSGMRLETKRSDLGTIGEPEQDLPISLHSKTA